MHEIAEKAEFAIGTLYKFIKNKEEPYYLAIALDSLTDAFLFLWLEAPERHPYPDDPDTVPDILFKGLVEP